MKQVCTLLMSITVTAAANPILDLWNIGGIKFGSYTLKGGQVSPIYFNLRTIISVPSLLKKVSHKIARSARELSYDSICGVPYTALPLATLVAYENKKPMLMRRKEIKNYGIPTAIEGIFKAGDTCLIIEDVITTGESILETIHDLEKAGLVVRDIIIFIDRNQGGTQRLEKEGYHVHVMYTLDQVLETLRNEGLIDDICAQSISKWARAHQ